MISGMTAFVAIMSGVNVTSVVQTFRTIDSIATKDYVTLQLADHKQVEDKRIIAVETGLDRIRAFTEIVPQLKDLLTLRCMGTPNLNATIDSLERQYFDLTKEVYREPSCDRLVLTPR